MAMGKAIVSTIVGVEGLPIRCGEHLRIADEPRMFAEEVVRLLRDAKARTKLECNARSFVREHCGWDSVTSVFARVCREITQSV